MASACPSSIPTKNRIREDSVVENNPCYPIDKDHYYTNISDKLNRGKMQFPTDSQSSRVLWNIDQTVNPLHIGRLFHLLSLNILSQSHETFAIIHDLSVSDNETVLKSSYEILSHFKIGSVIRLNDIYYEKKYQRSFLQLMHSVKMKEAMESICQSMTKQDEMEIFHLSDFMSSIFIINNILYYEITHVLIDENQVSLYHYIRFLLANEYNQKLAVIVIPIFPVLSETNEILLDITKDQIHQRFSKLNSSQQIFITNYLKAAIDLFYDDDKISKDLFSSNATTADIIDHIRRKISSCTTTNDDNPIYIAASFLTDQFYVLKKHWKKNLNKDDKCTGTGKGINDLEANQKGFEPPLGGKFIIINWSKKEIVYTLDIDSASGFFIKDNLLYIANNRLHYISIIDLHSRIEIKRIENPAFNCLHSLNLTKNETLLVTSTGIDAIIEINFDGQILNDWYATEHNYTVTPKGDKRNVQRDFAHHHYIYPTLHQTTHVNSAIFFDSDHYLATLFHQGLLIKISRITGESEVLLSGLNCPHGIKHYQSSKENDILWMLCNTKHNELLFLNKNFQIIEKMILEDIHWLQDAAQISNGNILLTDANHARIVEIDPLLNTVVGEFDYSIDWRVYQITALNEFRTNFVPTK